MWCLTKTNVSESVTVQLANCVLVKNLVRHRVAAMTRPCRRRHRHQLTAQRSVTATGFVVVSRRLVTWKKNRHVRLFDGGGETLRGMGPCTRRCESRAHAAVPDTFARSIASAMERMGHFGVLCQQAGAGGFRVVF